MSLSGTSPSTGLTHHHDQPQPQPTRSKALWDTSPISLDGPTGWDSTRVSLRAKNCPWHLTLLNTVSGHVFDYVVKCDSWTHRECAEKMAVGHLRHIRRLFAGRERIWVAHSDYSPELPGRLRQRRHSQKRRSGLTAECVWIRRPSFVFVFATAPLIGNKEPQGGEWMTPWRAHGVARTVMWLPGIGDHEGRKAVNYSKSWRRKDSPSSGLNTQIAIGLSPKDEQLVRLAYQHLGAGEPIPELGGGWRRPPGLDQETWITALAAASEIMSD